MKGKAGLAIWYLKNRKWLVPLVVVVAAYFAWRALA